MASPHTRGWTARGQPRARRPRGFPAHAGMDPGASAAADGRGRLPRTRGDGPGGGTCARWAAGASPHTRGWTRPPPHRRRRPHGFPAHAGMDPTATKRRSSGARLPRTRGDGPWETGFGACAGLASPHTRGWTQRGRYLPVSRQGFPAHAGMDPARCRSSRRRRGLPRTRGDGPRDGTPAVGMPKASPHTRGWTRCGRGGVQGLRRLPRTRGDGPPAAVGVDIGCGASPHTRGWTRGRLPPAAAPPGFPAHAGMDP